MKLKNIKTHFFEKKALSRLKTEANRDFILKSCVSARLKVFELY